MYPHWCAKESILCIQITGVVLKKMLQWLVMVTCDASIGPSSQSNWLKYSSLGQQWE